MTSAAQALYELETLDTRVDHERAELESVRRRLQRDPELVSARLRRDRLSGELTQVQLRQHELESQIAVEQSSIDRWSAALYGGTVRDVRELTSLQHEIELARERVRAVEDDVLACMERTDTLELELTTAERRLQELEEQRRVTSATLSRDEQRLVEDLAALEQTRARIAGEIAPVDLTAYERLRKHAGHAVSAVQGGVCQWCRVQLPARDVQRARGSALVACTNCARILYVPETGSSSRPAAT